MRLNGRQGLRPCFASGIAVSLKGCGNCDLVFADPQPIPASFEEHFGMPPEDYWGAENLARDAGYFRKEIDRAECLIDFQPGMRALDIGARLGKAMRSLKDAEFEAFGIETSAPFRDRAIAHMGADPQRLALASLKDAEFEPSSFDFITFGAVLEHLQSPSFSLGRAMTWLKPGGIIQCEVPSSNWLIASLVNLYYRLRGTNYVTNISPMHAPFHLFEFGLRSFEKNGAGLGYEIAYYEYMVCEITHVPGLLKAPFRRWTEATNSGMQVVFYLRKKASNEERVSAALRLD